MSALILHGTSSYLFIFSVAIQHFVPALFVCREVCPLGNVLLMPKSAKRALRRTSAKEDIIVQDKTILLS
jgi:hypothetical protein